MAEKLKLGPEIRELKLGSSFTNCKSTAFHTLRYDFKPASVDVNKVATVDVGSSQQVTVTVPHQDGSGTMHTVFKGSHRPYQRECVLIIDRNTGEITLERLSNNIQLKKTRMAPSKNSLRNGATSDTKKNGPISAAKKKSPPRRQSQKPSMSLGMPPPKHSPLPASPSYLKSPSVNKSPPQLPSVRDSPAAPGSLPMIVLDDPDDSYTPLLPDTFSQSPDYKMDTEEDPVISRVGILSASSSSNSSSGGDSSDSDTNSSSANKNPKPFTNGHLNGSVLAADLLTADLELSESGSDSDQ